MNTEVILYRQQLLENPRFANIVSFGWEYTNTWHTDEPGHIRRNLAAGTATLYQSNLLVNGATYRLRFKMYNRTTGILTIINKSGGTTHLSTTSNQIHIVEFTADGPDLIFSTTANFDGYISQTSLYQTPDKFTLDLIKDVPIPLNFTIDDIYNVQLRKAPFSNTIQLPGTHNNNKAFNQIYKLNSESLTNPNLKSRCIVKNSGITLFDGELCLDNVFESYGGNNIVVDYYKTQLIGKVISIIELLGNYTVKDLDFSEYDHVYDLNKIYGSWNNDIVINGSPSQPNTINSYTSPAISSYATVTVDGFKHPKITFASAHNLTEGDEICVPAGVEFSFDQTVMTVNSSTEVTLRCTQENNFTGTLSGNVTKTMLAGFGYWYPACDYGTIHNPSIIADPPPSVNYGFQSGKTYLVYEYNAPDDFTSVGGTNSTGNVFVATSTAFVLITASIVVDLNQNAFSGLTPKTGAYNVNTYTQTTDFWLYDDFVPHIFLREVFQKMMDFIGVQYDLPFEDEKWFRRIILPCNQDKFIHDDDLTYSYTEGQPISMNEVLPLIKLKDIFMSVVQIGNLGVIQDKTTPTKIKFIKRNTFTDNSPIEWSDKLHSGESLEISFLNTDLPKVYHFKYKQGEDHFNQTYKEEFGNETPTQGDPNPIDREYGDKYLTVRSDFLKSNNVVELPFIPTVIGLNPLSDIVNSKCYILNDGEPTGLNVNEGLAERRYSTRLLFAGLRTTTSYPYFNLTTLSPSYSGAQHLGLNYYPYAGHIANIDDLYPDWDLNWDKPLGVYLDRTTSPELERIAGTYLNINDNNWARNSLYNKNWKRFIESVTDRNGRRVTGIFKLTAKDIYELDFSIPIRVDDVVLKLTKVSQWDVNGDGLCKCEFLLK